MPSLDPSLRDRAETEMTLFAQALLDAADELMRATGRILIEILRLTLLLS